MPWIPGSKTYGLLKERRDWIDLVASQESFGKLPSVVYSADLHTSMAVRISDAAIYQMIMKESEQD